MRTKTARQLSKQINRLCIAAYDAGNKHRWAHILYIETEYRSNILKHFFPRKYGLPSNFDYNPYMDIPMERAIYAGY